MVDVRKCVAVALLMWIGVGAASARADTIAIVVSGNADTQQLDAVQRANAEVIKDLGWTPTPSALTKKESDALLSCKDAELERCLPTAMKSGALHHVYVIVANLATTEDGRQAVVLTGWLFSASPTGSERDGRNCEDCALDRVTASARDLAEHLFRHAASESRHTTVTIKSQPSGALITLDGLTIGTTDHTFSTYPGTHQVVLTRAGYATQTKAVTISENTSGELTFTLAPATGRPPQPEQPGSHTLRRWLGPALVGIGGVAVVTGSVLLAIDQNPSPSGGKQYLETAPQGYAIGGLGLVALGVGAFYWITAHHHAHTAPTASLVWGGGVVGWAGRF